MKRLEYVGLKVDGERAFQDKTGIEWMPGAVHDVHPEHAAEMLKHTDVWREVAAVATTVASLAGTAGVVLGAVGVPGAGLAGAVVRAAATLVANGATSLESKEGNETPLPPPVLPDWAKKGIELGATDEQLEAVAQAGGPETDAGALLWKDATGTDWKPAETVVKPEEKKAEEKKATPAKKTPAKKAAAKKAK